MGQDPRPLDSLGSEWDRSERLVRDRRRRQGQTGFLHLQGLRDPQELSSPQCDQEILRLGGVLRRRRRSANPLQAHHLALPGERADHRWGYVPVGISVGKPIRYPWAKYFAGELPLYVNEASPAGIRKITDQELFSVAYRKLLDQHGIGKFQQIFSRITAAKSGRPLALLCYEPKGEFCHRLLFAAWWREMTGDEVPEL